MTTTTWEAVERSAKQNRCRCVLRAGMGHRELRELGGGCTMPGYCCPTLDAYRRRIGNAPMEDTTPKKAHAATTSPPPRAITATAKPEPARYDPFASQVTRG